MRPFQIIIRLQQVRALQAVSGSRHFRQHLREVLAGVRSVADSAAEGDLAGYAGVCQVIIHRVECLLDERNASQGILKKIDEWVATSDLYVRRPTYRPFARSLALCLHDPFWGGPLEDERVVALIDLLTRPGADVPVTTREHAKAIPFPFWR